MRKMRIFQLKTPHPCKSKEGASVKVIGTMAEGKARRLTHSRSRGRRYEDRSAAQESIAAGTVSRQAHAGFVQRAAPGAFRLLAHTLPASRDTPAGSAGNGTPVAE